MEAFGNVLLLLICAVVCVPIVLLVFYCDKRKQCKLLIDKLSSEMGKLEQEAQRISEDILKVYQDDCTVYGYARTYEDFLRRLDPQCANISATFNQMVHTNDEIRKLLKSKAQTQVMAKAEQVFQAATGMVAKLRAFEQKLLSLDEQQMMDTNAYGKVNSTFQQEVSTLTSRKAMDYVIHCEGVLNKSFSEIFSIDVVKLRQCIWFFAMEKPFSAGNFKRATDVFQRIYKADCADVILADFYARFQVGREDALRDPIRARLKDNNNAQQLAVIASGLMWMNAPRFEQDVLQHMLINGLEMTQKMQERLRCLASGKKTPGGRDVLSTKDTVYFDVDALSWKDDEYTGLFEDLAFREKHLTYSLAVRDENTELSVPQMVTLPEAKDLLVKIQAVLSSEYGNTVEVRVVNGNACSGSGEETLQCFFATSDECRQMGILMHHTKIGRKLMIKFYTLFIPDSSDVQIQKQQIMSILNKLSPTVALWESSLKETMLRAMEQVLNAPSHPANPTSEEVLF